MLMLGAGGLATATSFARLGLLLQKKQLRWRHQYVQPLVHK